MDVHSTSKIKMKGKGNMKIINSKSIRKIIIYIIVILMLCNFVLPNYCYATTDTDGGGSLFDPLAKFLTFLCDSLMQFMQDSFVSLDPIFTCCYILWEGTSIWYKFC